VNPEPIVERVWPERTAEIEPLGGGIEVVGRVTSGGYGYTVERSIAYAYIPADRAASGQDVGVEIFGTWVHGQVAEEPLFDPAGERIRA
jgi:glycine cleavage system aminomethyltransferase T